MNRLLGLTAGTQTREAHLLPPKLKPCEKLAFSLSLLPHGARLSQGIPLGPEGFPAVTPPGTASPKENCLALPLAGNGVLQGRDAAARLQS